MVHTRHGISGDHAVCHSAIDGAAHFALSDEEVGVDSAEIAPTGLVEAAYVVGDVFASVERGAAQFHGKVNSRVGGVGGEVEHSDLARIGRRSRRIELDGCVVGSRTDEAMLERVGGHYEFSDIDFGKRGR